MKTAKRSTTAPPTPEVCHTPGPWGFVGRSVYNGDQKRVAIAEWRGMGGTAIGQANACLIAAAPELLTALMEARNVLVKCAQDTAGTPSEAFFKLKVRHYDLVIAKATGTQDLRGAQRSESTTKESNGGSKAVADA